MIKEYFANYYRHMSDMTIDMKTICEMWGENASFETDNNPQPHEANYLKLDCSKVKAELGWYPKWNIETTLKSIVDWNKAYLAGKNMRTITKQQIDQYFM